MRVLMRYVGIYWREIHICVCWLCMFRYSKDIYASFDELFLIYLDNEISPIKYQTESALKLYT